MLGYCDKTSNHIVSFGSAYLPFCIKTNIGHHGLCDCPHVNDRADAFNIGYNDVAFVDSNLTVWAKRDYARLYLTDDKLDVDSRIPWCSIGRKVTTKLVTRRNATVVQP